MRGYIYDFIVVLAIFTGLVFGLCGRYIDRRCLHCGEVTYWMPREGNKIVAARESVLDIVIRKWSNVEVFHMSCAEEHDFGGDCNCGS
jgi:hypothetical protein